MTDQSAAAPDAGRVPQPDLVAMGDHVADRLGAQPGDHMTGGQTGDVTGHTHGRQRARLDDGVVLPRARSTTRMCGATPWAARATATLPRPSEPTAAGARA
ncbi:hypothetical protein OG496_44950 [Streptomyces sp. NBC_00988]|nr:hypothetical protein OG496_44950 [Streptomyces sp. NBC_00988]